MTGLTDLITEARWEDILTVWFVLVDDTYQALQARFGPWRRRGHRNARVATRLLTYILCFITGPLLAQLGA